MLKNMRKQGKKRRFGKRTPLTRSRILGTELTTMTFRNTTVRTRNLHLLGNYLSILRKYTKTGHRSGGDKLIPHAIDALTADLIVQNLAIARPFAEMAAFVCYRGDDKIRKGFHEFLFWNNTKPFTSDDLSAVMDEFTRPVFGFPATIRPWRHIHVALRRKHCATADEVFERESDESIDSLQAGHTRSTENRIYGLTPDSLAGAEDVLPVFLKASTHWQKFLGKCHLEKCKEAFQSSPF